MKLSWKLIWDAAMLTAPASPLAGEYELVSMEELSARETVPVATIVTSPPRPERSNAGLVRIVVPVATNWPPRMEIAPPLPLPITAAPLLYDVSRVVP